MKKRLNCILLVDDNESDNFIHKRVLERAGIADHIEIAMNGQEALDYIFPKRNMSNGESPYSLPDIIFLDLNMPIMDGWEFLEEYNKIENIGNGKLVFIILTTSLNPADKRKAEKMLSHGCYQYKPLTLELIGEIMQLHFPDLF